MTEECSTAIRKAPVSFANITYKHCKVLRLCSQTEYSPCVGPAYVLIDLYNQCNIGYAAAAMSRAITLIPSVQFSLLINGSSTNSEDIASHQKNIVALKIYNCPGPHTTSWLRNVSLTNLVSFSLNKCSNQQVQKKDFSGSCQLRYIEFWRVTFESIEEGSFTNMPQLQHLQLESYTPPHQRAASGSQAARSDEEIVWSYRLHCSCQYSWLRKWIKENPSVVRPKTPTETFIMDIAYMSSARLSTSLPFYPYQQMFIPVDCATSSNKTVGEANNSTEFTANDPCVNLVSEKVGFLWMPGAVQGQ